MRLPADQIVALLVAVSFASGLNVYATVATLGLLAHFSVLPLPPGLHPLDNWWVIGAASALFAIEFFADKVPAFDLVWNALHTFIRVPVSALMAYESASGLSPGEKLAAGLAGAAIAFVAHGGKTALRAAVTPSPEPFSNMALSMGEDIVAVGLTWLSTVHPFLAASIAAVFIVIIVLLARLVWRALKNLFRGAEQRLQPS